MRLRFANLFEIRWRLGDNFSLRGAEISTVQPQLKVGFLSSPVPTAPTRSCILCLSTLPGLTVLSILWLLLDNVKSGLITLLGPSLSAQ